MNSMTRPKDLKKKKWKQVRKEKQAPVFQASHRFARISASKVRRVMDLVRGKNVNEAKQILDFSNLRGAFFLKKVLASALSNAEELIVSKKLDSDIENLFVKEGRVDEGPIMKRWLPRARGHATPIQKKTSHIHIILDELREDEFEETEKQEKSPEKEKKTAKAPVKKEAEGKKKKGGEEKKKGSEKKKEASESKSPEARKEEKSKKKN